MIIINGSYEEVCVELEQKNTQYNIGFPFFKVYD